MNLIYWWLRAYDIQYFSNPVSISRLGDFVMCAIMQNKSAISVSCVI